MCGIAGIYQYTGHPDSLGERLHIMNQAMTHRGPDEEGMHVEPELRSGLSVRRLSIVDPEHGSQPMFNEDRSVVVVCNGEIYNHRALRQELEQKGYRLRSNSDCEVLAHLYEEEGVGFLKRLNGMFALAILDKRKKRLLLARDPVGMKHLYWGQTPEGLAFASEARSLFAAGLVTPRPDWESLGSYFANGWISSPGTAFEGLQRLRPGSFVLVSEAGVHEERFWFPKYQNPVEQLNEQDYSAELKELFENAVGTHLDADVPAGLLLSGGWDSSLVSLYASRQSDRPLNSYSLVFPDDPDSDESVYSRQVAKQIGAHGHEIEVRDADILNTLSETSLAVEEPIVTCPSPVEHLVMQRAGHDTLHRVRRAVPHQLVPASIPVPLNAKWDRAFRFISSPGEEQAHLELLSTRTAKQLAGFFRPDIPLSIRTRPGTIGITDQTRASYRDLLDLQLCVEFTGRLADGILFVTDKVSMAHSLEVRMPFLDLNVVEFAHRLPSEFKVRNGLMKAVLAPLARELPPAVAQREKQGLHVPPRIYCSESLRKYYSETILETSLSTGLFDHHRLERWVNKLASNSKPASGKLFAVNQFCLWWGNFIDGNRSTL
jgi:asparagine synthase (glutamine-hydrolysing)